jgi:valyl-tRNA synthetase
LGVDTAFDEAVLKVGKRLATKLFHAARFIYQWPVPEDARIVRELDRAFVAELRTLVGRADVALASFDHAAALAETERFFWTGLADNYIELVKERLRAGDEGGSAAATLRTALSVLVRLFAPFLPFVTEEIWSWSDTGAGGQSVHRAPWPEVRELDGVPGPEHASAFTVAVDAIGVVRRHKTEARRSVGAPLAHLVLGAPPDSAARLERVLPEVAGAARTAELVLREDADLPEGFVVREAVWAETTEGSRG